MTEKEWRALELRAEQIARVAHLNQREESTKDPYILHVCRVMQMANRRLPLPIVRIVAWLHDVIEDTAVTADDLRKDFPTAIVNSVILLSRPNAQPYEQYIQSIDSSRDLPAVAVKLADLEDHGRPNCPDRLVAKYHAAVAVLAHWEAELTRAKLGLAAGAAGAAT